MPIKKSAKKFMRSTSAKTSNNNARKKDFRLAIKKVLELVRDSKRGEAEKALTKAQKALDKAAKAGVINKNAAARKKSRLAKKIAAIK